MQALSTALSAFSARATHGRRVVLLAYSGLIALVLLGVSALITDVVRRSGGEMSTLALVDLFAMIFLGLALFVIAPAMVAAQVVEERRLGTLDLLRTAPVSPTALTAGFLLGAPNALYLVCTAPLALHVLAGLGGAYPIALLPVTLLVLGFGALATMLFALVASAGLGREGGVAPMFIAGALGVGALIANAMASSSDTAPWAYLHPVGGLSLLYRTFDGPYRALFLSSWELERFEHGRLAALLAVEPLFMVLVYAGASALLMSAARRLLSSEPESRLEQSTALSLYGLAALAVMLPLRAIVPPQDVGRGTIFGLLSVMVLPYLACVFGITPTRSRRGRSPHAIALLMGGVTFGLAFALFGPRFWEATEGNRFALLALCALALTAPIYALWSATQIQTNSGRLAFWALIAVHVFLQVPAIVIVDQPEPRTDVGLLLARIGIVFGVLLPAFVAWRQHRADRASSPA